MQNLIPGALRLSIYIGENDKFHHHPLYKVIIEEFRELKVAGASVFRGIYGFGRKSHLHSADILRLSTDMPILIESIDTREKINEAYDAVKDMISEGIVVIEEVHVIRIKPD